MSGLLDELADRFWFLHADSGGYLAVTAPTSVAEVCTASARVRAMRFAFTDLVPVSDRILRATVSDAEYGRVLAVGADGTVVLTSSSVGQRSFLVKRDRSTVMTLAWDPQDGAAARDVGYDATRDRFIAGAAMPSLMMLTTDPPDGPVVWRQQLGKAAIGSPAAFCGYQVFAGEHPLLTCLQAGTGRVVWCFGSDLAATCPVAVNHQTRAGIVACGSTVYAVSMDTGAELWRFDTPDQGGVYARPRAFGSQVFVCDSYHGVLHALNASDGSRQWSFPGTRTASLRGLYTTPAIWMGRLFFGAWDGAVHAVTAENGEQIWKYQTDAHVDGVPLVTGDAVFVGNDHGKVTALDLDQGEALWSATVEGIVQARPALHSGRLLVATSAGRVHALNASSGIQDWVLDISKQLAFDIAVSDETAYLTTVDGDLVLLDLSVPGVPGRDTLHLGDRSAGAPQVFSGTVNAATGSGEALSIGVQLRQDVHPLDLQLALHASSIADTATTQTPPVAPAMWHILGSAAAIGDGRYTTAIVAETRRLSDDTELLIAALGAPYAAFLNAYDPSRITLKQLPQSIGGDHVPVDTCVTDLVLDNYLAIRPDITRLLGYLRGRTVLVTGHGQGGALALLCALDLAAAKDGVPAPASITCVTFGAPPVGNQNFCDFFAENVSSSLRVIVPGDITTRSPAAGWVHVPTPLTCGQGFPTLNGVGTVDTYAHALAGQV